MSERYHSVVFGLEGLTLKDEEKIFFEQNNPLGFILFARNIENKAQVKELVKSLKECVGRDCPVLIDQEGGRVARLKSPEWPEFPPMSVFAGMATDDMERAKVATFDNAKAIGRELIALGINVDCAPVCDLLFEGADAIIGDRSFGKDIETVSLLARKTAEGLLESNVLPIIKHIPGHGRAGVDSHKALPKVDAPLEELWESDFKVFQNLSDMPWAMTAHIVYEAIDPNSPATQSKKLIDLIRKEIGFNGVIISDDLSMEALQGSFEERSERSLEAGCDIILHCNGKIEEMQQVAQQALPVSDAAFDRVEQSFKLIKNVIPA